MNIVLFGKYPPIQGGVSGMVFDTSLQLAKMGHKIKIITNANQSSNFRQVFLESDYKYLQETNNNNIEVLYTTELVDNSYIPFSEPYLTKLFGKGLEHIQIQKPDLIIGWYYEPYGMAAIMLAKTFNIPSVIIHAGSDLGRLAKHDNLKYSYQWMLNSSDYLITFKYEKVKKEIEKLTTCKNILYADGTNSIFESFKFKDPFDFDSYKKKYLTHLNNLDLDLRTKEFIIKNLNKPINSNFPIILIYGKIGKEKGHFSLIECLKKINIEFNLIIVGNSFKKIMDRFVYEISLDKDLFKKTHFLPFLPKWRIGQLLKSSDISCFLEEPFDVDFHTPSVPREVLLSGCCLICSEHAWNLQPHKKSLINNENIIIINNKEELKSQLEYLLKNLNLSKNIGSRAKCISEYIEKTPMNNKISDVINSILKKIKNNS